MSAKNIYMKYILRKIRIMLILIFLNKLEYKRTGNWPNPNTINAIESTVESTLVREVSTEVTNVPGNAGATNNFLPNGNFSFDEIIQNLTDSIFKTVLNIFKPVDVSGHFDDLLGQQYIIIVLLLIVTISITILLTVYIFNNILLQNKDFIINRFNNRFILLYIKYVMFSAKLSLVFTPIIIYIGLFTMVVGLKFLVTHPVPYENLGIDLHTFLGKK